MEAGEIPASRSTSPPADYDPQFEWPGDETDEKEVAVGPSTVPSCRLVVLRSSVLPAKQTLVTADGYTELQFGRDPAPSQDIPRVRLKEMEVSKLHATAYADGDTWSIVDMGSKHGTFLQPRSSVTAVRLSPSRVASIPRRLSHLDTLVIGSTVFIVHIHPPCSACSSTYENEVSLFQSKRTTKPPERDTGYLPATSGDPKKALTMLKQRLLTSSAGPARSEGTKYTDRSARRRSLYPASRLDAPGVVPPLRAEPVASTSQQPATSAPWDPPPPVTTSQPPTPLPTTNIGHRLLLAQGWTPGSSLGTSEDSAESDEGRVRLTAPLEVASTSHRAGLGMAKAAILMTSTSGNWREDGRQRRWEGT
ncbi:Angiogenic factor with G patch and FHA domains 1 [Mycena sanguinolenta]|uniref:Angiogenic factor with G patch and FHA domains 1 n=1 Tax=Mycena sanguinolenta TaxID=230812 RepID=A0A8H6ZC57_9AGAR|nr:Angiogenic factor with G patch and FHA domains 1 [Mycena sanguinolenta]